MQNFVEITVIDWEEKYRPRKDVHNPSWFKLSNRIFEDQDFFSLNSDEIICWIWILSLCSQKSSGCVKINLDYVNRICRFSVASFFSVIKKLEGIHIVPVDVTCAYVDVPDAAVRRNEGVEGVEGVELKEGIQTRARNVKKRALEPTIVDSQVNPVSRYCELWKQRYKTNPPISGKVAGQIKTLVKDYGLQKTLGYIEAYLNMPDTWFITKRHDITTLTQNINAVAQFYETGRLVTKEEIKNIEQAVSQNNLLEMVRRGEV